MRKIGFGRYKDSDPDDVPEDYLKWFISDSYEKAKYWEEVLRRRNKEYARASWETRMLKIGYMTLMRIYDPEEGGSTQDIQEIKRAYEKLKRLCGE
jgi:hypothetical protein